MIDARYGPSLCTVAGVDHRSLNSRGNTMSSPTTEEILEGSQAIHEFYDLLSDALLEIEHLDHVNADSFIDPLAYSPNIDALHHVQWSLNQEIVSYFVFRAAKRHRTPIDFHGNQYPTYANLVVCLAQDALGRIDDIVYYEFDQESSQSERFSLRLPATKSEVERIRLQVLLEQSWIEGLIHQTLSIPEDDYERPESNDGPTSPCTWMHEGRLIESEMDKLAWRMVNYLWNREGKIADWTDLAKPVYGDREHDTSGYAIPSLRAKANRYFKTHKIPWRVTLPAPEARLISRIVEKNP